MLNSKEKKLKAKSWRPKAECTNFEILEIFRNLYNNFPKYVCLSEYPNFFISQRISKISIFIGSLAHRGIPKILQCMIKAEIGEFF